MCNTFHVFTLGPVSVGHWDVDGGMDVNSFPEISIIHVDSIMRAAHLEPVYGSDFVPLVLQYHHSPLI